MNFSNTYCLICNKSYGSFKDVFTTNAVHSQTPLFQFIERFTKVNLKEFSNNNVCDQCYEELNNYDLSEITCIRIQQYILRQFNETLGQNQEINRKADIWYPVVNVVEDQNCFKANINKRAVDVESDNKTKHFAIKAEPAETLMNGAEPSSEHFNIKDAISNSIPTCTFQCPKCPRKYKLRQSLTEHLKTCCKLQPKYKCEVCSKEVSRKSSLSRHMLAHTHGAVARQTSKPAVTPRKKRKFSDDYYQFGFTCVIKHSVELPKCIICKRTLSNSSMKSSNLNRHLVTNHPEHLDKPVEFFRLRHILEPDFSC